MPVVEEGIIDSTRHYTPKYNRISNYGLAIATTFDKLEVHAEGAYRDAANGYDDDFLAYIIGGSYSWDDLGLEFIEKISLYFEFAGERITNAKNSRKRFGSTDYSRPLKRSVLGSLIFKFNEDVDLRIGGSVQIEGKDCLVIEALPTGKEEKEIGYSKRKLWIRKDIFFTVKEYYAHLSKIDFKNGSLNR